MKMINGSTQTSEFPVFYQENGCLVGARVVAIGYGSSQTQLLVAVRVRGVKNPDQKMPIITPLQVLLPEIPWGKADSGRVSLEFITPIPEKVTSLDNAKGIAELVKTKLLEIFPDVSKWDDDSAILGQWESTASWMLSSLGFNSTIKTTGKVLIMPAKVGMPQCIGVGTLEITPAPSPALVINASSFTVPDDLDPSE